MLLLKLGRDEPLASMDSSGKIIWARHNEIQTTNLKSLPSDFSIVDGERLPLPLKDLGSSDLYPNSLSHNPNGRFVAVCGDGEYIVYTALAWRNKSFGSGDEFVWGNEASEFAIREGRCVRLCPLLLLSMVHSVHCHAGQVLEQRQFDCRPLTSGICCILC